MTIIELCRYQRADGGITVTPKTPDCDHKPGGKRIIADEGKLLTNGEDIVTVRDIPDSELDKWTEIDAPVEESEEQ
jgi:hypothetical protein